MESKVTALFFTKDGKLHAEQEIAVPAELAEQALVRDWIREHRLSFGCHSMHMVLPAQSEGDQMLIGFPMMVPAPKPGQHQLEKERKPMVDAEVRRPYDFGIEL